MVKNFIIMNQGFTFRLGHALCPVLLYNGLDSRSGSHAGYHIDNCSKIHCPAAVLVPVEKNINIIMFVKG